MILVAFLVFALLVLAWLLAPNGAVEAQSEPSAAAGFNRNEAPASAS
jgi:hypothetical protein